MRVLFAGRNYSQGLKESDPTSILGVARTLGIQQVRSLTENPDALICVDFVESLLPEIRTASRLGIPTVLIVNEPTVVVPQHSDPRVLRAFDRVVRVGRPDELPPMKWPQTWREGQVEVGREAKVVVVNADKWSFVAGQLYWLRAAISEKRDDVEVYGHGWDRHVCVRLAHRAFELVRTIASGVVPNLNGYQFLAAKPRNYMGVSEDKVDTMRRYKVALVIENSTELMTEKLFDAWFAGCIPVYVGPPLEKFGIPESIIIRCPDSTLASMNSAIDKALHADQEVFSKGIREFLNRPETGLWQSSAAFTAILKKALQAESGR